jgi:hypothetical protein
MALDFTQPLTEMSTRKYSEDKRRVSGKADNITANYEPII